MTILKDFQLSGSKNIKEFLDEMFEDTASTQFATADKPEHPLTKDDLEESNEGEIDAD